MKMQNWCQSNVKPGQFTGELVKNLLPKEHLQGGFQAWAKKVGFLFIHSLCSPPPTVCWVAYMFHLTSQI